MGQSIVPIVAMVTGESIIRCLGTGFFIGCDGLLVTAAHVVTDPIERKYGGVREVDQKNWSMGDLKLGVMVRTNSFDQPGYFFCPIEWATFLGDRSECPLPIAASDLRLTVDTAICKVTPFSEKIPFQPLSIIQPGIRGVGLNIGKGATAIGYAGMHDIDLKIENGRVEVGKFQFDLHVSRGKILERFPNNGIDKEVSTPGPCFSASLKLPPGMSGSPILDEDKIYVHGVASKGLADGNGPTDLSYGSMLAASLRLRLPQLANKSLLDFMLAEEQGITGLSIPDA